MKSWSHPEYLTRLEWLRQKYGEAQVTKATASDEAAKDLAGQMISKAKKVSLTPEQAERMRAMSPAEAAAYRREIARQQAR